MSGLAGIIDPLGTKNQNEKNIYLLLSYIQHRGDREHVYEIELLPQGALGCNRRAIGDWSQEYLPLANTQKTVFAVLDGKIYNAPNLRRELLALGYQFQTFSDTEVLIHGYQEWKGNLADHLDGMFAYIIYDKTADSFMAARDHIGIKPLYYLHSGAAYFIASEMKSLLPLSQEINVLPPGHLLTQEGIREYFRLRTNSVNMHETKILPSFQALLIAAVKKQVPTNIPLGVIFSGGLDSAAILSIASRYHPNITAFTVGFQGAADVEVARRYCSEMGIAHHIIYLNLEEMIRDLSQIIYYGETFESINIMDSCVISPAFRAAQTAGIQVVLCGDGSDEVLAGYDYFKTHPDPQYLMTYRLSNLHRTDLQRHDRCGMRYGVEARFPFLDKALLNFAYTVPMALKVHNGVEKWILREVLKGILPDYIVHRPKIRMPDGSGLKRQLVDFAQQQNAIVDPVILEQLQIDQADGVYFLEQYLNLGYPVPRERYKQAGLDFDPKGYFHFIT